MKFPHIEPEHRQMDRLFKVYFIFVMVISTLILGGVAFVIYKILAHFGIL